MGQWWKLINVDKKVERRSRDDLESLLRIPRLRKVRTPAWPIAGLPDSSIGTFIVLPPELVGAITMLLDHQSIICLALTSTYFYRLLISSFRQAIIALTPAWVGDRIVHIGDYAETSPPTCPEFVCQPYTWTPQLSEAEQAQGEAAANPLYHLITERQSDGAQAYGSSVKPLDNILRNLHLKQYVRLEALPESADIEDVGHLIEAYITWTDAHQRVHDRVGCKGPWAGCGLDIVDAADFEEREGWRDVTVEALDLETDKSG
ncbi:hypothetical protein B0A48_07432 [Cryoendolithus antarcticus]|uniref:F-box domain-containing protein n=1 Tax=Cryoendolithus antarcticus TaxID=1507870 RepID=A0A1V8T635_9PEZI|nr:hypothetical protein B0A48_07432 [Cryoendolithus antarcticus]